MPGPTYVGLMTKRLQVEVWSDIACPWCYVGKRRFEAALARFPHATSVDLVWRAFELDPSAPRVRDRGVSYAERLGKKYGKSPQQAQLMLDRMTEVAAADGLEFHFERAQSGNTFDAHRVLHLAHERGVQGAVKERFLRAYMTEGEPIGEPETLVRLGGEAGLDAEEVRAVLAGDTYAREVRGDEEQARAAGINGVPFFVFARRYAVSGAQTPEVLLEALTQAWGAVEPSFAEGATCGPDGC
jgi:predicted DsbA family dithiol-disulfide isomerase